MLEDRRTELKETISLQKKMAQDIKKSLSDFSIDMENLIHPMARGQDVRVRRDDIGYNLLQIKDLMTMNTLIPLHYPFNETDPYLTIWTASPDGKGGHFSPDQERINREVRNGNKVDNFQDEYVPRIRNAIITHLDNLENIHKTKVQAFENMDDEHSIRAHRLYVEYSSYDQAMADAKAVQKEATRDFWVGILDGAKAAGLGLIDLAYTGICSGVINLSSLFKIESPEWANKKIDDFKAGFSGIRNPLDFFEMIGQGWYDSYAENGLAYIAGNTTFDVATVVIPGEAIITKVGS
jgi:hypothetical protein